MRGEEIPNEMPLEPAEPIRCTLEEEMGGGIEIPAHLLGRATLLRLRQRRTSHESKKNEALSGGGNPGSLSRDLGYTARPGLRRNAVGHSHQFRGSGCQRQDFH